MKYEIAPKDTEIKAVYWEEATLYCFTLNINDKTGWRLPTKEELNEIYQSKNDFDGHFYWSSTVTVGNGGGACLQDFYAGSQDNYDKYYGGSYVRAVRSI
jgi:hypothetical protein